MSAWRKTPAGKASEKRRRAKPGAKASRKASEMRRRKAVLDRRPFIGIDGEGSGTDAQGRQLYMLLRAGDAELFTGRHLTTTECLDFILDLPPTTEATIVGFAFGYDITMILRDLPPDRRENLFADKPPGPLRWTYWNDYAFEYIPKNYIRIGRTTRVRSRDGQTWGRRIIPGSTRTIWETFGFFQMSFLSALKAFGIGRDHWPAIDRGKAERADFDATSNEVRRYCHIECLLLAELMEQFRTLCLDAGIRPRSWSGAGKLSKALHAQHDTPRSDDVAAVLPEPVQRLARLAYYGGRFEVTRIGDIPGPVHEYDIRSAYPRAMLDLPCLLPGHGRWIRARQDWLTAALRGDRPDALYLAPVRFLHPRGTFLCGLPVRKKDGRLFWPRQAGGVYWSTEIDAARQLGCECVPDGAAWRYVPGCDCRPFDWVPPMYAYRRSLGASTKGYPIKLGLNGLYGTLAQRIGRPQYANLLWASLITAATRARIMDGISSDPGAVIMIATDGIFARRPLPVPLGDDLGMWEHKEHAGLFVVQPGLYWHAGKVKTRGVTAKYFPPPIRAQFETAWRRYAMNDRSALLPEGGAIPPVVPLEITLFVGLRIAQARGKPELAGSWLRGADAIRRISYAWHGKRGPHKWESDGHVVTWPQAGAPDLISLPHASDKGLLALLDMDKAELDDQPDYVGGPADDE